MSRIGPTGGPRRPNRADGVGKTEGADKAKGAGFQKGLDGVQESQGADPVYKPTDATFERMRSRIHDGLKRGLSQEEILGAVIEDEIKDSFGADAPPEMAESVAQAFQDNGQLQSLFNQLVARVRQEG